MRKSVPAAPCCVTFAPRISGYGTVWLLNVTKKGKAGSCSRGPVALRQGLERMSTTKASKRSSCGSGSWLSTRSSSVYDSLPPARAYEALKAKAGWTAGTTRSVKVALATAQVLWPMSVEFISSSVSTSPFSHGRSAPGNSQPSQLLALQA